MPRVVAASAPIMKVIVLVRLLQKMSRRPGCRARMAPAAITHATTIAIPPNRGMAWVCTLRALPARSKKRWLTAKLRIAGVSSAESTRATANAKASPTSMLLRVIVADPDVGRSLPPGARWTIGQRADVSQARPDLSHIYNCRSGVLRWVSQEQKFSVIASALDATYT